MGQAERRAADLQRIRRVPGIFPIRRTARRWISDVRTALERHNIGWAMWDYSGSFGVATKKNGKATLDPERRVGRWD